MVVSLVFCLFFVAVHTATNRHEIQRIVRSDLHPSVYMRGDLALLVQFDKDPDTDSPLHETMRGARPDFNLFIIGQRMFDCKRDPDFRFCNFEGRQRLLFWTQTSESGIEIALNRAETRQSLFTYCLMIHLEQQVFEFKNRKEMNALLAKAEEDQTPAMLFYADKYGNIEHKAFMSVSVTVMKTAVLGYTNNSDITLPDRKPLSGKSAHFVVVQPAVDTDERTVFTYRWKFSEAEINKYAHIHTLPLTYHLSDVNSELPYDSYGLHIAYILLMPGQYGDEIPMIEYLARKYRDAFGFVIVNMKIFGNQYKLFGLDTPKKYPVLSIAIYGEEERFEFIDNPNSFNEETLSPFLNSTRFLYNEARDEQYVTVVTPENYREVVYGTSKDTLVIFCHDFLENCDTKFQAKVRRLGRGIHVSTYAEKLLVVYVPLQKFDKDKFEEDIDETSIPDIRFRRGNSQEFVGINLERRRKIKLKTLLTFIAQFGYTDVPVMKKRASDEVPLAGFGDLDFEAAGLNKEDVRKELGISEKEFENLMKGGLDSKEPEEMSHALERLAREREEEDGKEEKEKDETKKDETKKDENDKDAEKKDDDEKDVERKIQSEAEIQEELARLAENSRQMKEKIQEQKLEEERKRAMKDSEKTQREKEWNSDVPDEREEENDEIAAGVFVMEKKRKTTWRKKAPGLSEENFNETRFECDVLSVLFLSPWSAKSKASILIYNGVVEVFENSTRQLEGKVCLRHLDCIAHPGVCDRLGIYSYPTLKIFKKSSVMDYRGMMDVQSIVHAIQLSQFDSVIELANRHNLLRFVQNDIEHVVLKPQVTSLGLFKDTTRREFNVFKLLAKEQYTKGAFGACFGELAREHAEKLGVQLPAVIIRQQADYLLSFPDTTFTFDGSMSLRDFYHRAQTPIGELTPTNFPIYRQIGLPLVIAFVSPEHTFMTVKDLEQDPDSQIQPQDRVFLRTLYRLGKEKKFTDNLLLSWMNADKYGYVLASYSLESSVPTLAIVDYKTNNVYTLSKPGVLRYSHLRSWIEDYLDGKIEATSKLKDKEWKPTAPAIDFVAKEEMERAKKMREEEKARKQGGRFGRVPPAQPPRFTGEAPTEEIMLRETPASSHEHVHAHHEL